MILRDDRYHSLLLIAIRPRKSTIRCLLLYFPNTPALPFTMVAPVPAQITKLRPCLHAAAPRRALLTTYHSPPTLFLPPSSASLSANISPVLNSFRILPVATGVYHSSFPTSDFQMRLLHPDASTGPPGMPSLLFASACCLFVVSLHSFLPSLPLFSIVWSLFPQNTRGGVPQHFCVKPRCPVTCATWRLYPLCPHSIAL